MPSAQPGPAVLLVDDTPSIRQFLLHALAGIVPWELVAVPDATAALAVLAARPVPLLIADYHLNDMRYQVRVITSLLVGVRGRHRVPFGCGYPAAPEFLFVLPCAAGYPLGVAQGNTNGT
jgi:hypothetical protein